MKFIVNPFTGEFVPAPLIRVSRFEANLINGETINNTTIFKINHGLGTQYPGRMITEISSLEEVYPLVDIVSPNEVTITFSPAVLDNLYHAVFWF